jgi:hypothetical protein
MQYYTLEEAARRLGMTPDDLKKLAERGDVRPFRDRASMRFRTQEIDELARLRGQGSNVELEVPPRSGAKKAAGEEEEQVEIGQKTSKKPRGPTSPAPAAGSDSDVRLVQRSSDAPKTGDSDVRVVEDPVVGPRSGSKGPPGKAKKPETGVRSQPQEAPRPDSGVKMVGDVAEESVPLGAQSPKTSSDSDIRLDLRGAPPGDAGPDSYEMILTEEIDLDAQMREAQQKAPEAPKPGRAKRKTQAPNLPTTSPFELSDADLGVSGAPAKGKDVPPSTSDFDLSLDAPSPGSDEIPLELPGEQVEIGEGKAGGRASGINLQKPSDSGIPLEAAGAAEDVEFELSLDAESTPKPGQAGQKAESSSEFELSLEDEPGTPAAAAKAESDSEFELTLDEEGGLAPLEDEAAASSGDKDIFETDFEVPALEDESGSGAVALESSDTDLESSDFDLALGEEDIAADEESGSQVVALEDEDEADDAAATVERPRLAAVDDEDLEAEEDADRPVRGRVPAATAEAIPWGPLPAIFLIPCAILLILGALMGFELVRGMWGYRSSNKITGLLIDPISKMFGSEDTK